MFEQKFILLLDDDKDLCGAIELGMKERMFRVISCHSLSEAKQKVLKQEFDIILIDYRLEKGEGTEIIDYLKRDEFQPNCHTPLVLMSGAVDKQLFASVGNKVDAVIIKPIGIAELHDKIVKIIAEKNKTVKPGKIKTVKFKPKQKKVNKV